MGSVQANFMLMHSQKVSNGIGLKVVLITPKELGACANSVYSIGTIPFKYFRKI